MAIAPDNVRVLQAALVHDLHEIESGDLPYPFKKEYPVVAEQVNDQDMLFRVANDIFTHLEPADEHILKWADMFELFLFSAQEVHMGNQFMIAPSQAALKVLGELGPPTEAAKELFEKVTSGEPA